MERKALAFYLRNFWFGSLPPLVAKKEGDGKSRFLSLFELEKMDDSERLAAVSKLPSEYDGYPWRRCKLGCHVWKSEAAACQRHVQISHPGLKVTDVFDKPFICQFRLPRPLGALEVPEGPYSYCFMAFQTEAGLKAHREAEKHTTPKKDKAPAAENAVAGVDEEPRAAPADPENVIMSDGESEDSEVAEDEEEDEEQGGDDSDDEVEVEDDDEVENEASSESDAAPPPRRGARKRTRTSLDNESMDELQPPRPPPKRRGDDLQTTFDGLLADIRAKVASGRLSHSAAISEITRIISTKAFVRSDSVEAFAKEARRKAMAAGEGSAEAELHYRSLLDRLSLLEWN